MTNKPIKLHRDTSILWCETSDMLAQLREHGRFSLFLEFTDPASDCLVQKHFPFYPKVVSTPSYGHRFLTEHKGLLIRIPSDPDWWFRMQQGSQFAEVPQSTTCLIRGELVDVKFPVTIVGNAIRLPSETSWEKWFGSVAA